MCGICGFVGIRDNGLIHKMNSSLWHRGPDAEGFYEQPEISLGHRRLSIIDLSDFAKQPMSNENGTIWLVINGEIYNFLELRDELEGKGHKFRSKSDSEVVIHAYEEYGDEFLKKIDGMFALAIWDASKRQLFLARDRLGKKPLYYWVSRGEIIFASQIKALLLYRGIQREINQQSLNRYLLLGYVPSPDTMVKGIFRLPAGHYLKYSKGEDIEILQYWSIPLFKEDMKKKYSEEFYCENLFNLLVSSIKKRTISDVPLGIFLSGGLDSSLILSLYSKFCNKKPKVFTIGFEEESYSEVKYARIMADYCGADYNEFIVKSQSLDSTLLEIMPFFDEPVADPSFIPTYILTKLFRKHIKVAISGDGGDEEFAGYVTHKNLPLAYFLSKMPNFVKKNIFNKISNVFPASFDYMSFDYKLKVFMAGIQYPFPIFNFLWLGVFTPEECCALLKEENNISSLVSRISSLVDSPILNCKEESILNKVLYLDNKFYLQNALLVKVDLMSMANALEVRSPYLDYRLVEFVARIPSSLKLKNGISKYILKKTFSDYLPRQILDRKKQGFSAPIGKWLFENKIYNFLGDILNKNRITREGFFKWDEVEKIINDHLKRKRNNWKKIWALLIFELWKARYIDEGNFN